MGDKKEILLTGFGPFGDVKSNPAEKLILSLKEQIQDELYQFFVLPVSYSYCSNWSAENITELTTLVIHFGVSAQSKIIQLERTGHNVIGSSIDVDGMSPGGKILQNGPETIQSGLNLELVCNQMNNKGFKCELSDNAGDYLCNFIFYKSLNTAAEKSLFVHIPSEREVSLEDLKEFTLELIRNLLDQVK